MILLLHSSKTMRSGTGWLKDYRKPLFIEKSLPLAYFLKTLSVRELEIIMHISTTLATKTHVVFDGWEVQAVNNIAALDSFVGDIYSGLQAHTFTEDDRKYADGHLLILSGLYGALRPLDSICPYRLELGYHLPSIKYANLYNYWSDTVAKSIPALNTVINLSSAEYSKLVLPFINSSRVVTPRFMSIDSKTNKPVFYAVHAKIARGALARWILSNRIEDPVTLKDFAEIGYRYDSSLSTDQSPVFVAHKFQGKGLSVRLNA
jgi:cytoplasmic iron level regulating protein YaaA (DUF328/UPF0246 family)